MVVQLWPVDILNCVSCFLVKKHAAFKWKYAIFGFPVSPGSAEALVRCGGKINYILIAYFFGNVCAKSCRNQTVYVKIIASCKGGTFFETQSIICGAFIEMSSKDIHIYVVYIIRMLYSFFNHLMLLISHFLCTPSSCSTPPWSQNSV